MEEWKIEGQGCTHTIEYFEPTHMYVVDGIIVDSVTKILLSTKFGKKYQHINRNILAKAADRGTRIHRAIEFFCKTGEEEKLTELKNFKFLQRQYGFEVVKNEVPVILFASQFEKTPDGLGKTPMNPIAAGRVDMVMKMDGKWGLADIKTTSVLDKEYCTYQLNIYRIAYMLTYGVDLEFLYAIHLRDNRRKLVEIPINDACVWEVVDQYVESQKKWAEKVKNFLGGDHE